MTFTPKLPPAPMRTITFALPDALLDRLDTLAVESNAPRAQIVREAVELLCSLHQGPVEALGLLLESFEAAFTVAAADEIGETKGTA